MSVIHARALRKAMTRYEVKLWLRLRGLTPLGFRFRRQAPVGPYIVDFACFQSRLIVEVDGGQHGFDKNATADRIRDTALETGGFRVLRFGNADVWENIDGVVETIIAAWARRPGALSSHSSSESASP